MKRERKRVKTNLDKIIAKINARKNDYCRISNLQGWRDYLEDGDMAFTPKDLDEALKNIISIKPHPKLLYPRKKNNFTAISQDERFRPEEALERFITLSNSKNFCNQFPLRIPKEYSDIFIINDDSRHILVELKSWESDNSPLYAIVESIKNLFLYRTIRRENIPYHQDFKRFNDADIIVLAPRSYYQFYDLIEEIDDSVVYHNRHIDVLSRTLNYLGSEFDTKIIFMMLNLKEEDFLEHCKKCKNYKEKNGKKITYIFDEDALPELARDEWEPLIPH